MDWLNAAFGNTYCVLPTAYTLLFGEFLKADEAHTYFISELNKSKAWVLHNAPLVHFIVENKPWRPAAVAEMRKPSAGPEARWLFERWRNTATQRRNPVPFDPT